MYSICFCLMQIPGCKGKHVHFCRGNYHSPFCRKGWMCYFLDNSGGNSFGISVGISDLMSHGTWCHQKKKSSERITHDISWHLPTILLPFRGICWVLPPPSNSHHQDYYIFSRESQPKPSFATVTGRGDNPRYVTFAGLGTPKFHPEKDPVTYDSCHL